MDRPIDTTPKKPTNGRGVGIGLLLWGLILFAFEAYCALTGWPVWAFRVVGLVCLLTGAALFGVSFEKPREG